VERRGARQQIEGLEDEADFLVADMSQLVVIHLRNQARVQVIFPLRRRIQASDQVHHGRFAGSGRAHDGHIFSAMDLE
jgi:hypothetical protein